MSEINVVIFSKNRAMQLDCLLASIYTNFNHFGKISVLYKADMGFTGGYSKLIDKYKEVNWVAEKYFIVDTKRIIRTSLKYTVFLVDDIIFFRKENFNPEILKSLDRACCVSLRLGLKYKPEIEHEILLDDYILFDWVKQPKNFGYPFSVDGHIFQTEMISKLISDKRFINPNQVETNLQGCKNMISKFMIAPMQAVCFSNILNRVSDTSNCTYGEKFHFKTSWLENKYMEGHLIDFENMDYSGVNNCHFEVDLKFKKC